MSPLLSAENGLFPDKQRRERLFYLLEINKLSEISRFHLANKQIFVKRLDI